MSAGGRVAQLTARKALAQAGGDPAQHLERAASVTNEVWLGDGIVLRVGASGRRLLREAELSRRLPPTVGYPEILHAGKGTGVEVMLLRRLDALPLAHVWPDLDEDQRRTATTQLASRIRALHSTDIGDLPDIPSPQLVTTDADRTVTGVIGALRDAAVAGFDRRLLRDAEDRVRASESALTAPAPIVLVHGDLTFENVLWHDDRVVAVLDLEYAARRPVDLELEPLLRLCGHPDLHVGDDHVARTKPEDFAAVPRWFHDEYDVPFRVAGLVDRLNIYAIGFCAWELTQCVPTTHPPPGHPVNRLKKLLAGDGYIDRFLT